MSDLAPHSRRKPAFSRLFLDHPTSVGETYWEHFAVAFGFGSRLVAAGAACFVHGLLPFLFTTTGSTQVRQLHARMSLRGPRSGPDQRGDLSGAEAAMRVERLGPPVPIEPRSPIVKIAIGAVLCTILALLANWAAPHLWLPPMLVVLLLGILVRLVAPSAVDWCAPGVRLCAKRVLQVGVALLGLRLVFQDLTALGWRALLLVLASTAATLAAGALLGRLLRQRDDTTAIASTSVAICGASAALAAAATTPSRPGLQRETGAIIVTVSLLGTVVMVLYPLLAKAIGFNPLETSVLLGAAIHDVAQVAGAGLTVSSTVAAQAVTVKMIRVACLLPVVLALSWRFRPAARSGDGPISPRALPIPPFLLAFIALAVLASSGLLHGPALHAGQQAATWALSIAVAAIGLNTSPKDLREVPPTMFVALIGQTLIQLGVVMLLIKLSF